jgi:5-methylcytosine-specific restriction endonuclease McrA
VAWRRCNACGELHELGSPPCRAARERERDRWAEQSRRRGPRPYDSQRWKEVAQAAKTRDGFRCRGCGSTDGLNAHHVDPDPERFFELANVVTLCSSCHRRAEHARPGGRGTVETGGAPDHASHSPRENPGDDEQHVLVA